MNHVIVVRKDKIEKIEMAENLRCLVSLVSKPVSYHALSNLIKNRDNNGDDTLIKTYYENIVRFTSAGREYNGDYALCRYFNVNNVLGGWFDKIRYAMTIVAKECGEIEIANYVKPSSGIYTHCELSSICDCESLELDTFNIVSFLDDECKTKMIVKNDGIEHRVEVNDNDVILVTDEVDAVVEAKGHIEILAVCLEPTFNSEKMRNKKIEDYLSGNASANSHINSLLDDIMYNLDKPAR